MISYEEFGTASLCVFRFANAVSISPYTGQLKLRHDVRACEYADVHVMWKMLKRNETETVQFSRKRENKSLWRSFHWARCTSMS
ncbi:hypothetical protein OIU77_025256 [Salix suchowensis]|uniref:Uncharacterized protein n=2 Tax=Salix TaxID=40685 RepID=A0A9Q0PD52_SALPP|nr:elongation factor [Salix suchowensis]KAJ6335265.1 hypothetical protein OIU78_011989 [Salix suchowensis]KAJ6391230.1 hypothetical protein OIU77_025256 [Salix suchowensis]KAJ6685824.1 hypothetical protein OIU79_015773 [Salix purpurea]